MTDTDPAQRNCRWLDTRASLLLRLRDGRESPEFERAWSEFHEQYAKAVFRWCCEIGVSKGDAPDLTQDVMCLLLDALKDFEYNPELKFRSWLKTLTKNLAIDFLRKHQRIVLVDGTSFGDVFKTDALQTKLEQMMKLEEAKCLVASEMRKTKTGWRNWLIFRATTDLRWPPAVVARRFGVVVQLVYVEKYRVMSRLRKAVSEMDAGDRE